MPVYQKEMPELMAQAKSLSDLILGNKYKQEQIAQQGDIEATAKEAAIGQKIRTEQGLLPVEQQKSRNQADIDHQNLVRSVELAKRTAAAQGMAPGKFSLSAGQNSINVNPEALSTQGAALDKAKKLANITGYDIANPDAVIPSQKDAEEVKSATAGYKTMEDTGNTIDKLLKERNALDMLGVYHLPVIGDIGTSRAKSIDARVGSLLMAGKNQEQLGALQAPEIALMEKMQGGVGGIGAAFNGTDEASTRLQQFLTGAKRSTELKALSRGYTPQPGYLDKSQQPQQQQSLSAEDQQALQWAQANPNNPDAQAILKLHGGK